jgi:gliding motility-associated-like protein
VQTFEMLVFDRWGMLVFRSDDITKGWDGTYLGNACQQDVYVWRVIYTDAAGKKNREVGHVTLLR